MQVCAAHGQRENTRDEIREQWVLRERFVVVVVVVVALVFVFVSETRVCPPSLWPRGMLSGCIVQRFSLPFVHGRLADRGRHP